MTRSEHCAGETIQYRDRAAAGRWLAEQLTAYTRRSDIVVLALPRGGVPVACAVAAALHAPLDVCLVRKLGVPGTRRARHGRHCCRWGARHERGSGALTAHP